MIVDVLKNKELYYGIHKNIKPAMEFIEKAVAENLEVGRYELDGKNLFALVQEYDSKTEAKWEYHRKYIDIQFIVSGKEIITWDNIKYVPDGVEYNEEKDIAKFDMEGGTDVVMEAGYYSILYPQDLHQPGRVFDKVEPIKKIVVKIAV